MTFQINFMFHLIVAVADMVLPYNCCLVCGINKSRLKITPNLPLLTVLFFMKPTIVGSTILSLRLHQRASGNGFSS